MSSLPVRRPSFTTYQELSEYRNLFSCLICLELFTNPRILDCNHIFCEQCLLSYYALFMRTAASDSSHDTLPGASLSCPTCRKLTSMSVGGPAPLTIPECKVPPDPPRRRKVSRNSDAVLRCDSCFFLYKQEIADFYCSKCVMNFCKTCRLEHDQQPLFKGHFVIHISNKETLDLYCAIHSKMTSVYFCHDCNLPVCVVCILHDHASHNTTKLRDALTMRRDHLKTLLNDFGPRLDKLEAAIKTLDDLYESEVQLAPGAAPKLDGRHCFSPPPDYIEAMRDTSSTRSGMVRSKSSPSNWPPSSFHDIVASIVKPRESPSTEDQTANRTQPLLPDSQRDEYKESQPVEGSSSRKSSTEATIVIHPRQLFNVKKKFSLGSRFRPNGIHAAEVLGNLMDDRSSSSSPRMRRRRMDGQLQAIIVQVQRHRKLFNLSTKILDMSQSKKLFAVYEDMVDRIKTFLEVEFKFLLEELTERTVVEAARQMATTAAAAAADSTPQRSQANSANSSIRSSKSWFQSGRGGLKGPDGGSPLSMLTRPKLVWKIEKQRSDAGEMWNPCDVTFLADDTVVVAEYDSVNERNNKLQVFDTTGKSLAVLAQGQIRPLGVAITREGNIAVTDCRGKRVKIMTQTGHTVTDIGKGQFGWPYGIAVNSRGQLIVTDAFNDTVSIYQTDGKRVKIFGSTGSQHTHFRNPYHVTVDSRDNIIVSDSGNNAIKVFDPSGKFLFYTTDAMRRPSVDLPFERKVKRRTLKGPRGIAVDLKGNMLVADDCCRVCMFDSMGRYMRNLLNEEDSVKYPEAVRCSSKGLLAVTEWNPNNMFAVKVFTMYE